MKVTARNIINFVSVVGSFLSASFRRRVNCFHNVQTKTSHCVFCVQCKTVILPVGHVSLVDFSSAGLRDTVLPSVFKQAPLTGDVHMSQVL